MKPERDRAGTILWGLVVRKEEVAPPPSRGVATTRRTAHSLVVGRYADRIKSYLVLVWTVALLAATVLVYDVGPAGAQIAPAQGKENGKIFFSKGVYTSSKEETDPYGITRTVDQFQYDINAMNEDGGGLEQLTNDPDMEGEHVVSPDGTKVAYLVLRDVYVKNADGSGTPINVSNSPEVWESELVWSPDGDKLAFTSYGSDDYPDIFVANADGRGSKNLTNDGAGVSDTNPVWSPNGEKLAFETDRDTFTITDSWGTYTARDYEVYVIQADGTQAVNVSEDGDGKLGHDFSPAWSPDSTKVAFGRTSYEGDYSSEIRVADAGGSGQDRSLASFSDKGMLGYPAYSPNGEKITFLSGEGVLYVVDTDGNTQAKALTNRSDYQVREESHVWSPDSTRILFEASFYDDINDGEDIYVINADGTGEKNLTEAVLLDEEPNDTDNPDSDYASDAVFSPDGTKVAFLGSLYFISDNGTPNDPDDDSSRSNTEIYVANSDGTGTPTNITKTPTKDLELRPKWAVAASSGDDETVTTSVTASGPPATTDAENDGATADDPIETSVGGVNGEVTITETTSVDQSVPSSYLLFDGQQVSITAPAGTVDSPLVIKFTIDRTLAQQNGLTLPDDINSLVVFRNGAAVSQECPGATKALADNPDGTPNPCVSKREMVGNGDEADAVITVLTTKASEWNLGKPKAYSFKGFYQPVDNAPTFNKVKAGSAVPVKFSLGGDKGLNIFAANYPKSQQVTTSSQAAVDTIEQTTTATSGNNLSYDAASDQYTYVFKTEKSWAKTDRELVLKFNDGSEQKVANFRFTTK